MIKKIIASSILASAVLTTNALASSPDKFDFGINFLDKGYEFEITAQTDRLEDKTLLTQFNYYNAEKDNENGDWKTIEFLIAAEKNIPLQINGLGCTARLGFKPSYVELSSIESYAIPMHVSANLEYDKSYLPLGITASVDYAPKLISFEDIDSYLGTKVELYVDLDIGQLSVGYKNTTVTEKNTNQDLDIKDSAYIGFRMTF